MKKHHVMAIAMLTLLALGQLSLSHGADTPADTQAIRFSKIGYSDSPTFDTVFESLLSSQTERIAIVTTNTYDGITIPSLDGRLQSWLQLWLEANRNRKGALSVIGKLPSGSVGATPMPNIIELVFNLAGFDPHKSVDTILTTVERWAKDGAKATSEYAKGWNVQRKRKAVLRDYFVSFAAIDGQAVIILSKTPLEFNAESLKQRDEPANQPSEGTR